MTILMRESTALFNRALLPLVLCLCATLGRARCKPALGLALNLRAMRDSSLRYCEHRRQICSKHEFMAYSLHNGGSSNLEGDIA